MNKELSKVVVTLNNKKGIDAVLNTAERFQATQITNYEGIGGRPVFEFSIEAAKEDEFAKEVKSEFVESVAKK